MMSLPRGCSPLTALADALPPLLDLLLVDEVEGLVREALLLGLVRLERLLDHRGRGLLARPEDLVGDGPAADELALLGDDPGRLALRPDHREEERVLPREEPGVVARREGVLQLLLEPRGELDGLPVAVDAGVQED